LVLQHRKTPAYRHRIHSMIQIIAICTCISTGNWILLSRRHLIDVLRTTADHGGTRQTTADHADHGGPLRTTQNTADHGGPRRPRQTTADHSGPRRPRQTTADHGRPRRPRQTTADRPRRTDHGGPTTEDRPQRTDHGGPTTEDRPRRTDHGGPRTTDHGQEAHPLISEIEVSPPDRGDSRAGRKFWVLDLFFSGS
jgi:hypothetical protein